MIPRIFHRVWLGRSPMHPLMVAWCERWRLLHPSWEHWLWVESPSSHHVLVCEGRALLTARHPSLLDGACHLSQRSNLWRYHVVKTYGGVYLDPDIEPYRAIDGLIGSAEAFAVPRTRPAGCFESAIFGAEHEHPWVRELDAGLSGCDPGTSLSMGADYLTATLRSHPEVYRTRPGAIVFEYPEPDPWVAIRQGKVVLPPPERSAPRVGEYARHHWSSHWFAESFKRISP